MTGKPARSNDSLLQELWSAVSALENGQYDVRCNPDVPGEKDRELLLRINGVMEQLHLAAQSISEVLKRISSGDIPDRLNYSFPGLIGEIFDHLNTLIHGLNEIAVTSALISIGTVDDLEIRQRSDKDRTARSFNLMVTRLKDILSVIDNLICGVREGNLEIRGDVEQFTGVWKTLVSNINTLMEQLLISYNQIKDSEEKYRTLFESAPDGILITSTQGKLISFNSAAMALFKYSSRDEFAKLSADQFYQSPDKDRPILIERIKNEKTVENFIIGLKDRHGNPFIASLSARMIDFEGRPGIQTIIRDITRIIEMEAQLRTYAEKLEQMVDEKTKRLQTANAKLSKTIEQLEEAQEQLARKSYDAGMAEMAISVLHNIGNAVTPVAIRANRMVSTSSINPQVAASLNAIKKMILKQEIKTQTQQETAAKIIDTVLLVLQDNRSVYDRDMTFILNNINHIREIIYRQQRYAGLYGIETIVDLNVLLQDSIEMLKDSMEKRKIRVEMDTPELPKLSLDKNKMMQIFVNFLKNAYESIEMMPEGAERVIRVSTSQIEKKSKQWVQVCFEDTGTGITPEVKENMFKFNFSTKKRVTGFGLHDAANYIKAIHGEIDVFSKGVNQGAAISVRLLES